MIRIIVTVPDVEKIIVQIHTFLSPLKSSLVLRGIYAYTH